jgi:hypothetical protein
MVIIFERDQWRSFFPGAIKTTPEEDVRDGVFNKAWVTRLTPEKDIIMIPNGCPNLGPNGVCRNKPPQCVVFESRGKN